jgi:AhpD family alkylhydroperoxidase
MARIALPDGDQLEVIKALSLRPDFAKAVGGFDGVVWNSSLDWRLHELVRMRVATINECTVCLGWRTPMAVEAGVTDDDLAAVTDFTDPRFSPTESVALEYATHFCTDSAGIEDALMARLAEKFDSGEIVELTLVIAKYLAMGRFMQVLGLDQACSLQMIDGGNVVDTAATT